MIEAKESTKLIELSRGIRGPVRRKLFQAVVEPSLAHVLSLPTFNRLYEHSRAHEHRTYFPSVLDTLDVSYELSDEDRAKIPAEGPIVCVANHPFGGLDGVILGDILSRARPETDGRGGFRLLGNHLLASIPEMRELIIPVDTFGGEDAAPANAGALKAMLRWLREGHALGVFPAGTVSHLTLRAGAVSDPPWHRSVAALVRRTGATAVPIYFEGRNSNVFQLAGLIHPALRTALLPREMLKRTRSTIKVRIGRPIGAEKIGRYEDDATLVEYLRWKTYMLQHRDSPVRPRFVPRPVAVVEPAAVIEPIAPTFLAGEIARLPAEARLAGLGDLEVYIAEARQIPGVMREIGRLREITFRAVSEGTGLSCDVDDFDDRYLHLFMWNRAKNEIVGSYRFGRVDEILAAHGPRGLYTASLFKFKAGFLEKVGPALELGRSFIRAEYQRKPTSLALMWRGIGEYLVRNPQYKVLFGPVSISRSYQGLSKRLMIEFLERQHGDDSLSALVKPKNPPKGRLERGSRVALETLVKDADDVSALVSEIEEDSKGMPILLRHYLKLNARLLSFNVDPAFGHCIDGLIVVDLRTTEPKILKRFMGDEGYAFYSSVN